MGSNSHQLSVDNFVLEGRRQGNGWQIDAPVLNLKPMVKPGRKGAYRPFGYRRIPNLLALSSVKNYVFEPAIFSWNGLGRCYPPCHLYPRTAGPLGRFTTTRVCRCTGVGYPYQPTGDHPFSSQWHDVSWQYWGQLPGVNHFDGELSGSARLGRLNINLKTVSCRMVTCSAPRWRLARRVAR